MPDINALLANPIAIPIIAGGFAVIIVALLGSLLVLAAGGPKRKLRQRMATVGIIDAASVGLTTNGRDPAALRQKRIQERLQELEKGEKRKSKSIGAVFKSDLGQAGLKITLRKYLIIIGVLSAVLAGIGLFFLSQPLLALLIFVSVFFGASRGILRHLAKKRQAKFTAHFPNALDVVVRGVRSGLPIGECLAIIGRELPEPVAGEFRALVDGQKLGLTLDELMRRGMDRFPTQEYRFFAIVLQIQAQTGGNLGETLAGLAAVIRDRKKLRDKVVALSSEAKASASIIGCLPPVVAGLVSIMNPEYPLPLIQTTIGNFLLGGAALWMTMGVLVMKKMINFKI